MSRTARFLLGAVTAWPLIYMVLFIALIVTAPLASFQVIFPLHAATMLISLGLMIYYVVHVLRRKVPTTERLLWVIIFFIGACIAMPIYWYLYIWRQDPADRQVGRLADDYDRYAPADDIVR